MATQSSTWFSARPRRWRLLVPLRLRHTDPALLCALLQHGARASGRESRRRALRAAGARTCSVLRVGQGPVVGSAPRAKGSSCWSRRSHRIRNHSLSGDSAVISLTGVAGVCSFFHVKGANLCTGLSLSLQRTKRLGGICPWWVLCPSPICPPVSVTSPPSDRSSLPISFKAHHRAPVTSAPGTVSLTMCLVNKQEVRPLS